MCWSLEVSFATFSAVALTVPFLWKRNATKRDRWNAIFLAVFGSMQLVDLMVWIIASFESLDDCSLKNRLVARLGFYIIMMEPFAALFGRAYSQGKMPSKKELLVYFLLACATPALGRFRCSPPTGCRDTFCAQLTPNNQNIILGVGVDPEGGNRCWRDAFHGFSGNLTAEIPLLYRIFYLITIIYPYIVHMRPVLSGWMQASIISATWMLGLFSESHASVWCLANVVQIITMVADPYLFPPSRRGSPIQRSKRQAITQDRFSKEDVPADLDAVVVGSGIGGLATAALMARAGKKVLVLEQHYRAGGCTHTFDEIAKNLFDSGIHYVGAKPKLDFMMSMIGDFPVRMVPMGTEKDGYTYDEFDLGDGKEMIRYRAGREELVAELVKHFPHEEAGIHKYMAHLQELSAGTDRFIAFKILPKWLLNLGGLGDYLYRAHMQYAGLDADTVIGRFIKDKKLKALLGGGQLIDWNCEPNRTSWFVVGSMMNYYTDGGFYPEGGSHRMAEAIIPVIERAGGRVLCRAKVDEILVDSSQRATGVRVNGMVVEAKMVISDAGAVNTYEKLLDKEVVKKAGLQPSIPLVKQSHGHITAFVCLDDEADAFELRPANIHSFSDLAKFDYDISAMQQAFYDDPLAQDGPLVTLTCPSAKDPLYPKEYPGTSNVLMLTEAKWEWFNDVQSPYGQRSEGYTAFKKKFEQLFLDRLYKYYPKTKGHVTHIEIGTPLTTEHFIAAPEGGSYGLEWTPAHFDKKLHPYFDAVTPIKDLYLTGEASFFGGLCGAMASGFISAYKILGVAEFLKVILCTDPVDMNEPLPSLFKPPGKKTKRATGKVSS